MKKAFVLCLLAILVAFSGCGEKTGDALLDPNNPVAVTVWHYYNGAQLQAFDDMVSRFNESVGAEKGIVVDAVNMGGVAELEQAVLDAADKKVGASALPDVFGAYADTAYATKNRGLLAAVSDYLTEDEIEQYVPAYIDEGLSADGKRYMFPIAKSTEIFMMDMTTWNEFAAATGVSDADLATIEGVTAIAEKYYAWSGGKAFFGRDALANYLLVGAYQLGSEIFEVDDSGTVAYNTDETIMRKLWDNYYIPLVKGHFTAEGRFRTDNIKTGLIISLVGSTAGAAYFPTEIEYLDGTAKDIEVGVYPAPIFEGGTKAAVQQGASMVITKSTPQKEYAATVFLKWFTAPEQNIPFCIGSGYLPVTLKANDLAAIEAAVAEDAALAMSPVVAATMRIGVETANNSVMYTSRPFEDGTRARDIINASMNDQALADIEALNAEIARGAQREDALAKYLSDEHFTAWLTALRVELNAL